jgi:hypothetical protein
MEEDVQIVTRLVIGTVLLAVCAGFFGARCHDATEQTRRACLEAGRSVAECRLLMEDRR